QARLAARAGLLGDQALGKVEIEVGDTQGILLVTREGHMNETSSDAPAPRRPSDLEVPVDIRSISLTILAVGTLILLLRYAQEVLVPIVLSILTSYALWPIVTFLVKRLRFPRTLAAALVLCAATGGLGWAAYSVRFQAINLVDQIPEATRLVRREFMRGTARDSAITKVQEAATAVQQTAEQAGGADPAPRGVTRVRIEEPAFDAREYVRWGSMGVVGLLSQLVLIFFLAFFLLQSGDMFKRKIVKIAGPTLSRKKVTVEIMDEINKQIGGFLFVRVVTSVAVAVVTWLALLWLGVENAGVWGMAAGVLNSIPYFGPFIVSGALFVVAMVQFGNVGEAVWVASVAMVITALEGWLLTPALQGRVAQMNEVAVFIGLLFWSWVWGFWGAILAVPMMSALKAICDHVEDLQPLGELLGD
ncbi:MAG: AI-2E family transporter, partial [Acidobacteriota bacterium]|nr:AI-2E family transporter [Acidobacteriota bacterium]